MNEIGVQCHVNYVNLLGFRGFQVYIILKETSGTPPKINIEPEHGELEDDFPSPGVYSQVPC